MCEKKWIFYSALTVDVTSHLNDLNVKLQSKAKLIPRLVNDTSAFKMKFKPLISQLKSKDFGKFPQLREQCGCAEGRAKFAEYIEKIILIHEAFESRFSDFAEEENCILAFINPLSRTDQSIM